MAEKDNTVRHMSRRPSSARSLQRTVWGPYLGRKLYRSADTGKGTSSLGHLTVTPVDMEGAFMQSSEWDAKLAWA